MSTQDAPIEDLLLVRLNSARIERVDDPSYPYKLEANLRPPELLSVAFVMMCGGSEEMIVRGKTHAAIETFIDRNDLRTHPRLRWMTVTGPDGVLEEVRK